MADGKFLIGKPSGGVTTVTVTDGASNTNLVLPESGTVATQAYADGKTTLAQVKAEISTGSNLVTSPTGTIGYGAGAGGTVTQLTSKSTAVTLNKPSGVIIMNSAALAAGASVTFTLVNNLLSTSGDNLLLTINNAVSGYNYKADVAGMLGGIGAQIRVTNVSGSTLSESLSLDFAIIKGAIA